MSRNDLSSLDFSLLRVSTLRNVDGWELGLAETLRTTEDVFVRFDFCYFLWKDILLSSIKVGPVTRETSTNDRDNSTLPQVSSDTIDAHQRSEYLTLERMAHSYSHGRLLLA